MMMEDKTETSKTAVLVFVGTMCAAYAGRSMATMLFGPAWADPFTLTAMLAYFFFAYELRDNWIRAAIGSVIMFALFLGLNYLRLHQPTAVYHGVVLALGVMAVVGVARRKRLQPKV